MSNPSSMHIAEESHILSSTSEARPSTMDLDHSRGGNVLTPLLISTIGIAVVMPGLILQGVTTRTRAVAPGRDEETVIAPANGGVPRPVRQLEDVQAGPHSNGAASRRDDVAAPEPAAASAMSGAAESGHRPRRVRGQPVVPSARAEAGGVAGTANGPDIQPVPAPARSEDRVAARQAAKSPAVVNSTTDQAGDAETGLVISSTSDVANEGATGQTAEKDAPREPITFAEIQAAHAAAARNYRNIRVSLNESYRIIGRLNVERYEALHELAVLKNLPLPERPPERSWKAAATPAATPSAPLAAQRLKRNRQEPEEEEIDPETVKAMGRRRQFTVVAVIGLIVGSALAYRLMSWSWFPNLTDREALAEMAGIGIMMQVFFLLFFLFRLGTLTGKGKNWLFPIPEEEAWKMRRKRLRGR